MSKYRFWRQDERVTQKELSEGTGIALKKIKSEEHGQIQLCTEEYKKIESFLQKKQDERIARWDKHYVNSIGKESIRRGYR